MSENIRVQENRSHFCDFPDCPKAFRRREHLIRHLRSHFKLKSFFCVTCFKNFCRLDVLNKHRCRKI